MTLTIKPATLDDVPGLTAMNHQLIADEGSRNPMTVDQLAERMRGWLATDWTALLIMVEEVVVGYMLYQLRPDDYFPERQEVYIRQYLIHRDQRGRGIGRRAFEMIVNEWLPDNAVLTLEVLAHNSIALKFWQRLGFHSYSIALRREP